MICPKCGHEFEGEKERGQTQKEGMLKSSAEGRHMSRAPFGYEFDLREKMLVPSADSSKINDIYEEFLKPEVTLSGIAKRYSLSVNGLKKILRNFAYVGKVKFDGQIHEGKHKPIVSTTLFNHVQNKLDKIGKKT